jgi:hypothetical protein
MSILAIDPGTTHSGWVLYNPNTKGVISKGIDLNEYVRSDVMGYSCWSELAIEMIASYGMPVGQEVFDTCVWIGKFVARMPVTKIYRRQVKLHLCGSVRAGDANIRKAIIDRYAAVGGGRIPQIGINSNPGPLHGVSSHMWAALGVAITAAETECEEF